MHIHRRTFCAIAATKAALALGALSWLVFAPQTAFAGPALTDLARFNSANGSTPNSGVTLDSAGNLYGTALYGGANSDGAVYEIASGTGVINDLASFNGANGSAPYSSVTLDSSGNLFGTTSAGGANNAGTVFEIAHGSNAILNIASFSDATGDIPAGGVTLDSNGDIFGTTQNGGPGGYGTVYEIVNDGSHTITNLASFDNTNGADPYAGVTLDSSGNLYGTTLYGGDVNGDGTVYEIAAGSNVITTLASFNMTDGANPYSGVTLDGLGNLYGTASGGGANDAAAGGDGAVYEIAKGSGAITTLASFDSADGSVPYGGVILDSSGNLLGTTSSGGDDGQGTVYKIANDGSHTLMTLASFNNANGAFPFGGVTLDGSGNLYGTTAYGGDANGDGVVFEIANADPTPAPEPAQAATLALVVTGLAALLLRARRRKFCLLPGTLSSQCPKP